MRQRQHADKISGTSVPAVTIAALVQKGGTLNPLAKTADANDPNGAVGENGPTNDDNGPANDLILL